MASIFDRPGGDADTLNRKDYLNRETYIKDKYDVDPKERDKRLDKLLKDYLKDQKLVKNYGEDAMKSKGFLRRDGPDTERGGVYRNTTAAEDKASKKKKFLEKVGGTPEKPVIRKAKGGSVRAFNNGGAVMSGRGPKFKGIK